MSQVEFDLHISFVLQKHTMAVQSTGYQIPDPLQRCQVRIHVEPAWTKLSNACQQDPLAASLLFRALRMLFSAEVRDGLLTRSMILSCALCGSP